MPNNIDVTPGVGKTIAADDVGGALHQRVKLSLGEDGAAANAVGGAGGVAPGVQRMTLASDDPIMSIIGAMNEAAPGSDTAPAGLNGRLKRLAQNLTSILAAVDPGTEYEPVAAGSGAQVLGGAGAAGDLLVGLLIVPTTTSPGAVSIKDGSLASFTVFPGGANSVSNLVPFSVVIEAKSVDGPWQITTGANVSVFATGSFS